MNYRFLLSSSDIIEENGDTRFVQRSNRVRDPEICEGSQSFGWPGAEEQSGDHHQLHRGLGSHTRERIPGELSRGVQLHHQGEGDHQL